MPLTRGTRTIFLQLNLAAHPRCTPRLCFSPHRGNKRHRRSMALITSARRDDRPLVAVRALGLVDVARSTPQAHALRQHECLQFIFPTASCLPSAVHCCIIRSAPLARAVPYNVLLDPGSTTRWKTQFTSGSYFSGRDSLRERMQYCSLACPSRDYCHDL